MADIDYLEGRNRLARGDLDWLNTTIKVALLDDSHVPDATAHTTMSDINADETTGTNYTGGHGGSGRKTLSNKAINKDTGNNELELDADDPFWSEINPDADIGWAVVHIEGSTDDSDAYLIGAFEVNAVDPNGNDYTLRYAAEGAIKLTAP